MDKNHLYREITSIAGTFFLTRFPDADGNTYLFKCQEL